MKPCCSNVQDFGAKGDNKTDDTKAIQSALKAMTPGGGCLCIPPGTYLISQSLSVNAPIKVSGGGRSSIVKATADSFHIFILTGGATGSRLTDFQIQGAATSDASNQVAIYTEEKQSVPISVTVDHLLISGPDSKTGCNSGMQLDRGANDWAISHNGFERLIGISSGYGYGILVAAGLRNIISHNHFTGDIDQGRHAVYLSSGASYNIVAHNIVKDFNEEAFPINTYRTQAPSQYNQIVNNTIINGGTLTTTDAGAISITGMSQYNCISGNTIAGYKGHGIIVTDAGTCGQCIGNQVVGNSIYNVAYHGIVVMGAKNTDVRSNVVCNASQDNVQFPTSTFPGIAVTSSGTFGTEVCDGTNLVGNTSWGHSQRCAFGFNTTEPVPINTVVYGNKFLSGAYAGIAYQLNQVDCIFDDNAADQNSLRLGGS